MKTFSPFFLCLLLSAGCFTATAQNNWPRDVAMPGSGKITIYELQPETFAGNKLTGRAAVAVRKTANAEPVFGAMLFTASLLSAETAGTAGIASIQVNHMKLPGVEDQAQIDAYAQLIGQQVPAWKLRLSVADIEAAVKREDPAAGSDAIKNDPPAIIYTDKPTTLVVLDGEPQVLHDDDLQADKVVNSPNLIFKDGGRWNMYVGGVWYASASVTGGWKQNTSFSARLKAVNEQIKKQEKESNDGKAVTGKPVATTIMVATEPAELLQTDGPADYKTVEGTSLLYVSNSPNEIFKDINTQRTYVLVAGRWYSAATIAGPWDWVAADKLPADFARIPAGSDKDEVLASVAGTAAAEEARVDAEIPQTAKVNRSTATITVEYDGEPQFQPIAGTRLQLAENANGTVMIDASGRYFALDNGVWFVGNSARGPWKVANERPGDVEKIPASSPAYNTRYVYIYDHTPGYVYTGYTSGYMGGYIYGYTIVYGTGYHYRPWLRRRYFPRPVTWGFGFHYNPWSGWSMNWGFNIGFLYVGFYSVRHPGWGGGWFGPPLYRPPYRPPYWSGGYYGGNGRPRPPGANRPGNGWSYNNNIYAHHKGVVSKDIDRRPVTRPVRPGDGQTGNRLPGNGTMPVTPGITRPGNDKRPVTPGTGMPDKTRPVSPGTGFPGNGNKLPGNGNKMPGNDGRPVTPGTGFPGQGNRLPGNGTRPVTPGTGFPGNNKLPGSNNRPFKPGTQVPDKSYPPARDRLPDIKPPSRERVTPPTNQGRTSPVTNRPGGTTRPATGNRRTAPREQRPGNK